MKPCCLHLLFGSGRSARCISRCSFVNDVDICAAHVPAASFLKNLESHDQFCYGQVVCTVAVEVFGQRRVRRFASSPCSTSCVVPVILRSCDSTKRSGLSTLDKSVPRSRQRLVRCLSATPVQARVQWKVLFGFFWSIRDAKPNICLYSILESRARGLKFDLTEFGGHRIRNGTSARRTLLFFNHDAYSATFCVQMVDSDDERDSCHARIVRSYLLTISHVHLCVRSFSCRSSAVREGVSGALDFWHMFSGVRQRSG